MAVDVIIDPSSGKIYWNDNAGSGTDQSIAIAGNASNKIEFIGYSGAFSGTSGSAPASPEARVVITDSASDTLIPGVNGYELGNSTNRWAVSATTLNASGAITLSYSPVTGVNTNHTLRITSVPFAEASGAVIEMGATTAFDNSTANFFNGSANGTYLAIRSASTFTGDYLNFGKQDGTSTTFSVSSNGNVTVKTSNQFGFVVNDTANANKFVVDTNNTRVGIGKPADYPLDVRHTTANTNTVNTILALESRSSATTAAEFGSGAIFRIQNSSGTVVSSSGIDGILSVIGASYRGSIVFKTNGSGSDVLTEKVRISYNNILLSPYDAGNGTYELRFNAVTGANYVGFKAPDTISTNVMWTLPSSVGSTGQFLKVGASGVLSWDTITAGTGTVTSIVAGTGLTGGTITTSGTIAIDTTVVPRLSTTTNAFSSGNTTGSTTSSAFSLVANSLTSGTGAYFASNSVTSGKLVDIAMTGTAGSSNRYALNIAVSGSNTASVTSHGVYSNVTATSTVSAVNIAGVFLASGGAANVPIRLGSSTGYVNFFINTDGTGITLSPSSAGTPFFTLGGYSAVVPEFRLCEAGGFGAKYVGFKAPASIAASKIWELPGADGSNGQVLTWTTGGILAWTSVSGSGSGTVSSGSDGKLAYYAGTGTVVDDASALSYATTGTNLTITASAIGVIPLAVTGITGQTASIFKAILDTTDAFVISNAGVISTGTWNASTIGVLYGGTGQTSYTNGQILIGNTTGNTLTKATLTAGSGVDIANGAGSIIIRQKRPLYLTFCSGFTPVASGVDSVVLRIPDSPADGSTSISYNVRELFIRVETPSAGTTSIQVEYYTGTSAFTATNMMSAALSITGASTYEAATTSFSQTTLASGNKVRLNFTALNSTHANFFVQLLLEEA